MTERRHAGLCFTCDDPFTRNLQCKNLFEIIGINDYDTKDSTNSLLMMISTTHTAVHGSPPMYLAGSILVTGVHILVDTGATHNVIDINVARAIGLLEQRVHTTILVGSGNKVPCRAAAFRVPLRIDTESFQVDTFLFEIGNNINAILGTP
jgi:hypothetical protein